MCVRWCSIFRGSNGCAKETDTGSWRHSLANHGFDSTLRNLIDDSVLHDDSLAKHGLSCSSGMNSSSPRQSLDLDNDAQSAQGYL